MHRSSSDPQRGLYGFFRASSIRLSGYLSSVGITAFGRKRAMDDFPRSKSRLFYGFCNRLGGQVRIKVERAQLVFKLIDYVKGNGNGASPRLGLLNIFSLPKEELLSIKVKSATLVQFKLHSGVLYPHLVRLGFLVGSQFQERVWRSYEETQGGCCKLMVNFPAGTLEALVKELKVSRFARKERYGFLGLRTKLVPFKG